MQPGVLTACNLHELLRLAHCMSPSVASHSHMPGCERCQGQFKDTLSPERRRKRKISAVNN
eukprot:6815724-Karenia_brevis.AAC.1